MSLSPRFRRPIRDNPNVNPLLTLGCQASDPKDLILLVTATLSLAKIASVAIRNENKIPVMLRITD